MNPNADEVAQVIVEEGIKVVTTGAGNPAKYMQMWKDAGVKVIPVVASVSMAKLMTRQGASALIAEGGESGGHIGELNTMVLVPQICDATDLPVLAAGGIAGLVDHDNVFTCCYNAGNISGSTEVGAITGTKEEHAGYYYEKYEDTAFKDCYYLDNGVSARGGGSTEGIKSFSADQMGSKETFKGFDFNLDWKLKEGTDTMPRLQFSDVSLTE